MPPDRSPDGSPDGSNELNWLTVGEAHELLQRGDASSVELTRACLDRIDAVEERVRSFVTLTPDLALEQAEQADRRLAEGNGGPLTGIPVQVKDVMCTQGILTTCASRMWSGFLGCT